MYALDDTPAFVLSGVSSAAYPEAVLSLCVGRIDHIYITYIHDEIATFVL